MHRIILLCLLSFWMLEMTGQTGQLEGKVTRNDKPVAGALIAIPSLGIGINTDLDGNYRLQNIPIGTYKLQANMIGYVRYELQINIESGKTIYHNIQLSDDPLQLNEMVVSATRMEISQQIAPVMVHKISSRTLEVTQALSISEGLSFSPGLRLENNCQNCGFTQLRMNGLEGPYTQILINSRPVFSALAGIYGLDMIPSNMVDRIEVIRGNGSVLYGGNAIAGTVNIITKEPMENSFNAGLHQSLINLESPDRVMQFNGSLVNKKLDKGIVIYGFNRERQAWDANQDGFSEIALLSNKTFGMDAFWNLSSHSKIKASFYNMNEFRRGGNDFAFAPHESDIAEQLKHEIRGGNVSWENSSKNLKHKISLYASLQSVQRDSYYGSGGRIINLGDTLTASDYLALNAYGQSTDLSVASGWQYSYEFNPQILVSMGSEFRSNKVNDAMPGYERSIKQSVISAGNYLQMEWKANKKLTLLSGFRYDYILLNNEFMLLSDNFANSKTFHVLVPRVSVKYDWNEKLKLRASFAQGYRAPQAFDEDLHIETVGGAARFIRLDSNLIAEKSNSFTASANYYVIAGAFQWNFIAESFYTHLNNPFILSNQQELANGTSVITKRNGAGAIVKGINLEANVAYQSKIIFQSGFTLQNANFVASELIWEPENPEMLQTAIYTKSMLRTPNAYGYYTLIYKANKALNFSLSGTYTGHMKIAHVIDPETSYTVIKKTKSFYEQNFRCSYAIDLKSKCKLELIAGMHNIFNSFQSDFDLGINRDAGYIYGPNRPRTIFAGVKFAWE